MMLEVRSLLEEFTSASQGEERLLDNLTPQQRREHVDLRNSCMLQQLHAATAAMGACQEEKVEGGWGGRRPNRCATRQQKLIR